MKPKGNVAGSVVQSLFDFGPLDFILKCILKGHRGNCIYNRQWELNSQSKGWMTAFNGDRKKALCKSCDQIS